MLLCLTRAESKSSRINQPSSRWTTLSTISSMRSPKLFSKDITGKTEPNLLLSAMLNKPMRIHSFILGGAKVLFMELIRHGKESQSIEKQRKCNANIFSYKEMAQKVTSTDTTTRRPTERLIASLTFSTHWARLPRSSNTSIASNKLWVPWSSASLSRMSDEPINLKKTIQFKRCKIYLKH